MCEQIFRILAIDTFKAQENLYYNVKRKKVTL